MKRTYLETLKFYYKFLSYPEYILILKKCGYLVATYITQRLWHIKEYCKSAS